MLHTGPPRTRNATPDTMGLAQQFPAFNTFLGHRFRRLYLLCVQRSVKTNNSKPELCCACMDSTILLCVRVFGALRALERCRQRCLTRARLAHAALHPTNTNLCIRVSESQTFVCQPPAPLYLLCALGYAHDKQERTCHWGLLDAACCCRDDVSYDVLIKQEATHKRQTLRIKDRLTVYARVRQTRLCLHARVCVCSYPLCCV